MNYKIRYIYVSYKTPKNKIVQKQFKLLDEVGTYINKLGIIKDYIQHNGSNYTEYRLEIESKKGLVYRDVVIIYTMV